MSKRHNPSGHEDSPLKGGHRPEAMDVDQEMGEFEDQFEDEFESDEEVMEAGVDGRPDAEREADEKANAMDVDPGTFIVGRHKLEPGQVLEPDPSTYEMLHNLRAEWPCLSFDIVRDPLGDRKVFPATMYMATGTQAEGARARDNKLMVMKLSALGKMQAGEDSENDDNDDDDDDHEEADPILESKEIPLNSTTNRIRAFQADEPADGKFPITLTATMTESTNVFIHDITPHLQSFNTPGTIITPQQNKPLSTIRAHKAEGYALDWSLKHNAGRLLTGDNDGLIYMTTRSDGGGFQTDLRPFTGHTSSVEDIQWSPSEATVFASASSDGTIRVWDVRTKSRAPAITVEVSKTDVNVMSWSRQTSHLLASGADDGVWGVWDLRHFKAGGSGKPSPIASYDYHKEQITSVEWHPTDNSTMAVAAGDNTVTLWDLSVEFDDEESKDTGGVKDVPPQLLFVHYLEMAKELHWHPQISGALVATGHEFSVFKTISVPPIYLCEAAAPEEIQLRVLDIVPQFREVDTQTRKLFLVLLSSASGALAMKTESPGLQDMLDLKIQVDLDNKAWHSNHKTGRHSKHKEEEGWWEGLVFAFWATFRNFSEMKTMSARLRRTWDRKRRVGGEGGVSKRIYEAEFWMEQLVD
ncbi:uncharacterized protein MKZ38_004694 [Zalerion maritima]|uniref:Glutamate-rich WD repeat-containing protein 1 n=1 Tax=Zalerion maritima TaxID=339359 RepID=A0AAD5RLA5_9PEZI|nr:uncharacterized protein MKZ38_004694 [Zalerion maritima]